MRPAVSASRTPSAEVERYYSSRNYASRLIGDRLIFYTPLDLDFEEGLLDSLPGVRRWSGDASKAFRRIAGARNIYLPEALLDEDAEVDTLHSVTSCNLTAPVLDCSARAVFGPASRTFYVSPSAVYLWTYDPWENSNGKRRRPGSFLYRLPLGWERPAALGVRGWPVDQFSFRRTVTRGAKCGPSAVAATRCVGRRDRRDWR